MPSIIEAENGFPPLEINSAICNTNILHLSGYLTAGGEQSTTIPFTAVLTAPIGDVLLYTL